MFILHQLGILLEIHRETLTEKEGFTGDFIYRQVDSVDTLILPSLFEPLQVFDGSIGPEGMMRLLLRRRLMHRPCASALEVKGFVVCHRITYCISTLGIIENDLQRTPCSTKTSYIVLRLGRVT